MYEQNDEAIVLSVLKGNVKDFRHLVDRHGTLAYRTAFSVCQSHEEAQEITQDAFIKAFASLAGFQRKSKFSTWLFRIVYYTALNHLEKIKGYKKYVSLYGSEYNFDEPADFTIPGQLTQRGEQEKFVQEALVQLNPEDRLALSLFYLEEKPQKKISELTGWSLSAVKVRLFRARNKMQEILEKLLVNEKEILP